MSEHIGWHHTDAADTERAAARANPAGRRKFKEALLALYISEGSRGLTDSEAQLRLGMSLPGDAGARRHDLVADGYKIEDSGERRLSPRGRPCIVWVLV